MTDFVLGELPENLSSLAKFRPADMLDFGRRAKNLAKFLEQPLQESQELLARAYGYAHLHELQQVLKTAGVPGPYDDRLADVPGLEECDAAAVLRYYRHNRLMQGIAQWDQTQEDRFHSNRDSLACDLGLFSSAPAHRECVKGVKEFLETGTGYSSEGFPYGFNGALRVHFTWYLPLAEDAFAALEADESALVLRDNLFDPRKQLAALMKSRAPSLFLAMVAEAAPQFQKEEPTIELLVDSLRFDETEELLQSNFDDHIGYYLTERWEAAHQATYLDSGMEEVWAVLREPTDEKVQACELTRGISNFRAELAHWRLSLRVQLATIIEDGTLGKFDEDAPEKVALTSTFFENHCMTTWMSTVDSVENIDHWRVSSTLLLKDLQSGLWSAVGTLTGDYIIPTKNDTYSSPGNVISEFDDCGDGELYWAWHLLQSTYLTRAGYSSYGEWINDEGGCAVANLRPWIAPAHRGSEALHLLFDTFVRTFEENSAMSWDSYWKLWATPAEEFDYEEELDANEWWFSSVGLVFIPMWGTKTLGFSVWADNPNEASGQLVRAAGENMRSEMRRARMFREPLVRKGLGWSLLDAVKEVSADFVLFDPQDAGDNSED